MTLSPRASSALTRSIFCTSLLVLVQGCGLIKGFGEAEEGADMAPAVQDMFSPDEAGACQQVEDCDTPFDDDCDGAINEGCACGFLDGKGVCGEGTLDDGGVCTSPLYETGEDESQCGDGLDNNCDGVVDDGCPCDFKGIAQGLCAKARVDAQGVCDAPALYVLDEVDTCDGEDNDCDGLVDEGCGCAYKEFDEGVCAQGELEDDGSCGQPEGYLTTEEDDSDSNVHCDGLDNDCDGVVDEGCECAFMELTEGVCAGSTRNMDGTCEQPDTYFATQPGEPEPANLCDGLDNDCDGEIDEGCPTLYTQAVMGDGHMCALTRDGEVECRGRASFNRLVPPAGPFESLTAGDSHTCGLRADGSVACWGRDDLGQSSPPPGQTYKQLSSHGGITCGIQLQPNEDRVSCWGDVSAHPYGDTLNIPTQTFSGLAIGHTFACAIVSAGSNDPTDGDAYCWGVLPDWPQDAGVNLIKYDSIELFEDVDEGTSYGCGIERGTNRLRCTGDLPPDVTSSYSDVAQFALHPRGLCMIDLQDSLSCVGSLNGFLKQSSLPATVESSPVEHIALNSQSSCAVSTSGQLTCWGGNVEGSIAGAPADYVQVHVGELHRCGVRNDGSIDCVAVYHPDQRTSTLDSGPAFAGVEVQDVGHRFTCGRSLPGTCSCWGIDYARDDAPERNTITLFSPGTALFGWANCAQVDANVNHICGLDSNGALACQGDGSFERFPPMPDPATYRQVVTTRRGTCGLTTNDEVRCWGQYDTVLSAMPPGLDIEELIAGEGNICALTRQGSVHCTGVSSSEVNLVPAGLTNVTQVALGTKHACALTATGDVTCWGQNDKGQSSPPAGTKFSWISAAARLSCGLKGGTDALICW